MKLDTYLTLQEIDRIVAHFLTERTLLTREEAVRLWEAFSDSWSASSLMVLDDTWAAFLEWVDRYPKVIDDLVKED